MSDSSYTAAHPIGDYVSARDLVVARVRERDRQLIEAIGRAINDPPFRPPVRVYADDLGRLRVVIGAGPGFATAVLDEAEVERARITGDLDRIAEALVKAGRSALDAIRVTPEPHIELGQE